jgi:hypothetical protein
MALDLLTITGDSLVKAFQDVWLEFLRVIPGLIAALIVIIIGIIVARIVKKIVEKVLEAARIDAWIADHKLSSAIGNAKLSKIVGVLVKWYVIVLFLAQAMDLIGMKVLRDFTAYLVRYIPKAAAGAFIFVLGLLVAKYVRVLLEGTGHKYKRTVATVVEWLVIYVVLVIALQTAGINVTILVEAFKIAVTAFAIVLAIIIGIVAALSFKKEIQSLVNEVRKEVKTRR